MNFGVFPRPIKLHSGVQVATFCGMADPHAHLPCEEVCHFFRISHHFVSVHEHRTEFSVIRRNHAIRRSAALSFFLGIQVGKTTEGPFGLVSEVLRLMSLTGQEAERLRATRRLHSLIGPRRAVQESCSLSSVFLEEPESPSVKADGIGQEDRQPQR